MTSRDTYSHVLGVKDRKFKNPVVQTNSGPVSERSGTGPESFDDSSEASALETLRGDSGLLLITTTLRSCNFQLHLSASRNTSLSVSAI